MVVASAILAGRDQGVGDKTLERSGGSRTVWRHWRLQYQCGKTFIDVAMAWREAVGGD